MYLRYVRQCQCHHPWLGMVLFPTVFYGAKRYRCTEFLPPRHRCKTSQPRTSTGMEVQPQNIGICSTKWRCISLSIYIYIHIHIHIYKCTQMGTYIYINIYIYICVCILYIVHTCIYHTLIAMICQDMFQILVPAWPALMTQGQDQRHARPTCHFASSTRLQPMANKNIMDHIYIYIHIT